MGKIVAASATVHAPQLFFRPPSEDPAQLDADIAAMRQVGRDLDEVKPDAVIVIGNDHLETFFLTSVPTFAIMAGERAHAEYGGKTYDLPVHQGIAEDLLHKLMDAGFDMAYSQEAVLGHSFAAVYEWVIEKRSIPVVPIFVNAYLPPLPTARRCQALGQAIAKMIAERPERVAIIASGGMSHFPGTWKYAKPDYDFDYWAIAQMEKANYEPLLNMTNEQFDQVGNTELLPWMVLFGAIGNQPAELITYQPTWHHGHAVLRFLPDKRTGKTVERGRAGARNLSIQGCRRLRVLQASLAVSLQAEQGPLRPALQVRPAHAHPDRPALCGEGIQPERRRDQGPGNASDRRHRALQERDSPSAGQNGRASARHVDERASDALRIAQAAGRRGEVRQREGWRNNLNERAVSPRTLSRAS